jgi:YVTN family beta-propeller protein
LVIDTNPGPPSSPNLAYNTVIATIDLGGAGLLEVEDVTVQGNRVYVTNFAASIHVVDTETNTVIETIPVGEGPRSVAVTPDGTRAYVPNIGFDIGGTTPNDSVSVIAVLQEV